MSNRLHLSNIDNIVYADNIIGNVKTGLGPTDVYLNPLDNYLYAVNYGSSNISIIDGNHGSPTENKIIGNISMTGSPGRIAYC